MNYINKLRDIIPGNLYYKILKLLILTIIGIFFELLGIGLVLPIITIVTTGSFDINLGLGFDNIINNFFSKLNSSELFIIPLLLLLLVYTAKGIYLFFLKFYTGKFSYHFVTNLSNNIYKNYLYQDHLFHLRRNSTDLIRIITFEILNFFKNVFMPSLIIFMEILVLIGIIFLLLSVETKSTLSVFGIILFLSLFYYFIINNKLKKWGEERLFHDGKKIQNLTQGLQGIKTVKIFNQEEHFLDKFNYNLSKSAKVNQYATLVSQLPPILIEFIAIFLIVSFMIFNVQTSSNVTEYFPKLALFAAAAFRVMPSINRLIVNFQTLRYAIPAADKLHNEFPLKDELSDLKNSQLKMNFKNEINISHLSFKYPNNNENTLQDVNLKIRYGESIGIIGKTGEGKSTIVDLICGLLKPHEGSILVDDNDIQKNLKSWQQKIGYVPQNIYLLDDSIKENIIFGRKEDNDTNKKLNDAIKLAQLDKLISDLPKGLNTFVGDRGTRLSGGQVQRIGIARAIFNNSQVLIFDEATSALDVETEKNFIDDIYKLKTKKTLIIISHRISSLERCDRIYNLKNKSIFLDK
jgi:ABC-type multidrug transport system fused ATPase/permease subunit